MHPRSLIAASLLLVLVLPALTTPTMAASHEGAGEVVEVRLVETGDQEAPYAFEPAEITIEPGTTVRWINDEDVFHTVTSTDSQEERRPNGQFDESLSSQGATFEFTFEEAGTFEYYCSPHASFMFGTVTVEDDASSQAPLPGALVLIGLLGAVATAAAGRRR